MTLYIAVDGAAPEALDAADDELIADTVHQLLREEVLVQDIETVGVVEDLQDEIDKVVVSNDSLQTLANNVSQTMSGPGITPEERVRLSEAVREAYGALDGDNGE